MENGSKPALSALPGSPPTYRTTTPQAAAPDGRGIGPPPRRGDGPMKVPVTAPRPCPDQMNSVTSAFCAVGRKDAAPT